uniref:FtsW/RodA/SpoVE family cell cycle protein n=1 Tax=Parolsenella massiliensis TaxID=1871022 RepID=UPI0009FAF0F6|nr:putative peptidoglycan glycosyltransferase FtsW [Parolsenella massiliensis]
MTSSAIRPSARAQARARTSGANSLEKKIMGVPARIMRPCLLLIAIAVALTCFGLVMIYSASSVEAMSEQGDAAFYVKRQALFIVIGVALAIAVAKVDYHWLCSQTGLTLMAVVIIGMLVAVRVAGSGANGATRWLTVGPLRLQPSEFAKVFVLLAASATAGDYFCERSIDLPTFLKRAVAYVGVPLALILVQPDKGTTGIIALLVFVIAYDSGFDRNVLMKFAGLAVVAALVVSLRDDYSRQRVLTLINPWSDEWDSGYQLTRGFMAFGSGGLTGVGLGMSRMKYSYLPEAHNDFVFAIVGEELGLLGTLAVLAAFAALTVQAFDVARNASDSKGRLIAIGGITLLLTQFFLNVFGVLGVFPLSGKPLPFISYGGSSIMSCLMIVGAIVNVSLHSTLPETVHDRRRASMTLAEDEDTGVGEPRVHAAGSHRPTALPERASAASRPQRASGSTPLASASDARRNLRVVDGGAGRQRIDLGPDPAERLRSRRGPEVRASGTSRVDRYRRNPSGGRGRRE